MKLLQLRPSSFILPALVIAACVNAFLLVGWRVIDPTNVMWMEGDSATYQLSWEFLRREPHWGFPLTWAGSLGYPIGVNVAYFDSIPLFALAFRLLAPILPEAFQYLGLFLLLSSVLQAYFGYSLFTKLLRGNPWLAALGTIFLLIAPIFTFRALGHFALTAQWLIVASLSFYFDDQRFLDGVRRYLFPFGILLCVSASINPYLTLMVLLITLAASARLLLDRDYSWIQVFWYVTIIFIVMFISLIFFGFLSGGASLSADQYGYFSMNLLSPIDPEAYPSIALKRQSIGAGQYEGYNYLGLGVILLLIVSIFRTSWPRIFLRLSIWPLIGVFIVATGLAASTFVQLGSLTVANPQLPDFLFNALSMFRSSGHLFWPAHYLLIIAAMVLTYNAFSSRAAVVLVSILIFVQIADIQSLRTLVRAKWQTSAMPTPLKGEVWKHIGQKHRHLVVVPAFQCSWSDTPGGKDGFAIFDFLALRQRITVNSYYSGRYGEKSIAFACGDQPSNILADGLMEDTAYVLSPAFLAQFAGSLPAPTKHYCQEVDGFILCARDGVLSGYEAGLIDRVLPPVELGATMAFGPEPSRSLLFPAGWWPNEQWGKWTDALDAELVFRLPAGVTGPVTATMQVSSFVPSPEDSQRIRVSVGGVPTAAWKFVHSDVNDGRYFQIPSSAIGPMGIVVVRFDMPDAHRPATSRGGDSRLLGLAARTLRIDAAP